jgi:hypothetical protein
MSRKLWYLLETCSSVVFSLGSSGAVVVDKSFTCCCSIGVLGGGSCFLGTAQFRCIWGVAASRMRVWICSFVILATAFFVAWTSSSGKVGVGSVIVARITRFTGSTLGGVVVRLLVYWAILSYSRVFISTGGPGMVFVGQSTWGLKSWSHG